MRRKGVYPEVKDKGVTAIEMIYGWGLTGLRADHSGSRFKYNVHPEEGAGENGVAKEN